MPLFDDKVREQLKQILGQMQNDVHLAFFSQEFECASCRDTHQFVEEITPLSGRLHSSVYEFRKDSALAEKMNADKIPAIILLDSGKKYTGLSFFGIPGGYEINSFLESVLEVSGKKEGLPADISKRISSIKQDIHIQVFVSLACPYCPGAVSTAHRLALENEHIRADMVESATFPHLANRYNVTGVPKIIINENHELTGAVSLNKMLDVIENMG